MPTPPVRPFSARTSLALALALVPASGCMTSRHFDFTTQAEPAGPAAGGEAAYAPPRTAPQERAPLPRVYLDEVYVDAVADPVRQSRPEYWTEGRAEVAHYVAERLRAETSIAQWVGRPQDADYTIDVDVTLQEHEAVNGWLAAGLAIEAGVFSAFATAGGLIAARATHGSLEGPVASIGASIGGLVGLGPALALGLLPPGETMTGEYDCQLTIRRAANGAAVGRRHARVAWGRDFNGYDFPGRVAHTSGAAIAELERRAALTLGGMFAHLPTPAVPTPTPAAPATPPTPTPAAPATPTPTAPATPQLEITAEPPRNPT